MNKLLGPAGFMLGVAIAVLYFGIRSSANDTLDRTLIIGIVAILVGQALILAEITRWRKL
jgi:hypothetical protein